MTVWTKGQCPSNEKRSEDGAIKDDGYQSSNLSKHLTAGASCCERMNHSRR